MQTTSAPPIASSVYIAGPMRGHEHFNFPAFFAAETELEKLGIQTFNPAKHDLDAFPEFDHTSDSLDGFDITKAFVWDVQSIAAADGIALLPGWEKSEGANIELRIARMFDKKVFLYVADLPEKLAELPETPKNTKCRSQPMTAKDAVDAVLGLSDADLQKTLAIKPPGGTFQVTGVRADGGHVILTTYPNPIK